MRLVGLIFINKVFIKLNTLIHIFPNMAVIVIVLVLLLNLEFTVADKYMKIYNIVCEANAEYTEHVTCGLKVIGRNVVVANMELDTKRPFKNISVNFKMFKFYNQFRPFLVNVSFNVCDLLGKKIQSNFFNNLMIRVLAKYSNSVKCPLEVSYFYRLSFQ